MTWPLDKLSVCADALAITGNFVPNVADDGSDEWNIASAGYELAITYMIENHDWKFGTLVAILASTGTAPTDPLFDTAYAKPQDSLHIIWVRLNDAPVVYQILNNQIVLNAVGNSPSDAEPGVATVKYVRQPTPDQLTPTFTMALRAFVMSAIYRGIHEDLDESARMWKQGVAFMAEARSRSDQEAPKRAMFNSRLAASRRIRRPWPPVPTGWSGSGIPG